MASAAQPGVGPCIEPAADLLAVGPFAVEAALEIALESVRRVAVLAPHRQVYPYLRGAGSDSSDLHRSVLAWSDPLVVLLNYCRNLLAVLGFSSDIAVAAGKFALAVAPASVEAVLPNLSVEQTVACAEGEPAKLAGHSLLAPGELPGAAFVERLNVDCIAAHVMARHRTFAVAEKGELVVVGFVEFDAVVGHAAVDDLADPAEPAEPAVLDAFADLVLSKRAGLAEERDLAELAGSVGLADSAEFADSAELPDLGVSD